MKTIFAALILASGGCTPPALEPPHPTPTVIKSYTIGAEQTAGIGDAIFDVQSARKVPEFVALRSFDPGHVRFMPTPIKIEQGDHFRAVGKFDTGNWAIRALGDTGMYAAKLVVTPDGRVLGYYNGRGGYVPGKQWPIEPLFETAEGLEGQESAYRSQMIYSGLAGNTIRAAYREFKGDFIRPAFSQELQYNLAQDSTIAYKSIRIQVLSATNSQLRYRVKEDGGLPWLPAL
jgi:hypothetical protein